MPIAPGAFHLPHYLSLNIQQELTEQCRALVDGAVLAYVPVVRGGGTMHVRMLCLGRHRNGKTYSYEPVRTDFDSLPVPPLPVNPRTSHYPCSGIGGGRSCSCELRFRMRSMQKWEYRVVRGDVAGKVTSTNSFVQSGQTMFDVLNELGAEGWELVHVSEVAATLSFVPIVFYFRRPVSEQSS